MSLPEKICMNGMCGATTSLQWKRGWPMKAGGVATLCFTCGTEYDHLRYCERFHLNEPGWRKCKYCYKRVHCGCVVSKYLHECLDSGGISCLNCIKAQPLKQLVNELPNSFSPFGGTWIPSVFTNQLNNVTPLTEGSENITSSNSSKFIIRCTSRIDTSSAFNSPLPFSTILSNQLPLPTEPDNNKQTLGKEKNSSLKKEQKSRRQLKSGVSIRSKKIKAMASGLDNRVCRLPGEGRNNLHLFPRYWPKMTDQELSQINGDLDSNCTITPLFEKILSASDTGRFSRLVLPKACAESYFPPIDNPEGVPLKIQDIKGKDWTFHFRFWPNNNSRMYVLEGVTPCIQNMQLQAGDTVIFSRLDPENKLLIGCRKATVLPEASAPICTENGNLPTQHETKKTRNIGSKSKRLQMHSEDALELKFTWEEAQEYLRPPLSKPTVVTIENCELEEYNEPPVFGKKTVFTTNAAQRSCSIPEENAVSTLKLAESKKRKKGTTRHPRHRPGCSCIVCIQPPSGAGKHKPNCICTACFTVRRRFKTLMLRKKQRLEEEAEMVKKSQVLPGMMIESSDDNNNKGQVRNGI